MFETQVFRYDSGSAVVLQREDEFREYASLNTSKLVKRKRNIRLALRALDKQIVKWPYKHRKVC